MKMKLTLIALLAMFVFSGCSDSDEGPYQCSDCVDAPEALVANNASGRGIYKGIVVGSSGTLKINIANGGAAISAVLEFDGDSYPLETEGQYSEENGFAGEFVNDMDTETLTDDIRIEFSVEADGSNAEIIEVTIPGHPNATIEIYKELSTHLVVAFEGTYRGDASGTWNMVMKLQENGNGIWVAVSRGNDEEDEARFSQGEIAEGGVIMGAGQGVTVEGARNGDRVEGEWENVGAETNGTWSGKRTL